MMKLLFFSCQPSAFSKSLTKVLYSVRNEFVCESFFTFDIAVPIATPMATPIASQVPPEPKAASIAIPIPAPSAIPNPICIDGLFMSFAPLC
jgi:hypothetical protein